MGYYYLKRFLFFLLLIVSGSSFCQGKIRPFEDYSKCQTGFLRNNRDTLFPAKFEDLKEVRFPTYVGENPFVEKTGWIISENGKFGCLSDRGTWILPCEYESLVFDNLPSQFIAKQNGKYGMISRDTVRIPFEYDRIYPEIAENTFFSAVFAQKNGLIGLYSCNGKEIVPVRYTAIRRVLGSDHWGNGKNPFIVEKDDRVGLVSSTGKELISPGYNEITLFHEYLFENTENLFRVEDEAGMFSVFTESGKQLLPFRKEYIEPAYTLRSVQERRTVDFALCRDSLERQQFVYLRTGKESGWYDGLKLVGDYVLTYSNKDWSVLDTNFNVVYETKRPTDALYYFEYENRLAEAYSFPGHDEQEELSMYDKSLRNCYGKSFVPAIFAIRREIPLGKRQQQKLDRSSLTYYGLINLQTGQQSPIVYSDIIRIGSSQGIYYWAISREDEYPNEENTIDVYDSSGVFIHTICLDRYEHNAMQEYTRDVGSRYTYNPLFIAQNEEQKYGVRLLSGKKITPYVLDFEPYLFHSITDTTGIYAIAAENGRTFTDFTGKPLLGGRTFDYDYGDYPHHYWLWNGEMLSLQYNGLYTLVSPTLDQILLDSCSSPHLTEVSSLKEKSQHIFAVKGDYVYMFSNGSFRKLDATFFESPSERNSLWNKLFIDSEGKIIREEKKIEQPKTTLVDRIYLTLEGSQLIVEDLKHKRIQVIPNIKRFYGERRCVTVSTLDKKEGILDAFTGQWIITPKYQELRLLSEHRLDAFWANDGGTAWMIVDPKGGRVTDVEFDQTFSIETFTTWTYFRSNKHLGVISSGLEIIAPPIYDRVLTIAGKTVLQKDKEFFLMDRASGRPFPTPITHDMVRTDFSNAHLFLFGDQIEILSLNGEVLLPPTKIAYAIENLNLSSYLLMKRENRKLPYISENQIVCADTCNALRIQNNKRVIEDAREHIVPLQQLVYASGQKSTTPKCTLTPIFVSKYIYSDVVEGAWCFTETTNQKKAYRSYFVGNDQFVRMNLADLFIAESNYEQRLDSFMERQIQINQYFGPTCADIPRAIAEFKKNFYVNGSYLFFELFSPASTMRIPLNEFRDVLKHPEYFE